MSENELVNQEVVIEYQAGTIKLNNAEKLKQAVAEYASQYGDQVVTAESYSATKKLLQKLRKLKKNIEDKRKENKRAYEKPLKDFESTVKEIESPLNEVIGKIKTSTDDYDRQVKEGKRQQIQAFIDEECGNKGISSENIEINPKWLNKTATKKHWQEAVDGMILLEEGKQNRIKQNVSVIKTFANSMGVQPDSYVYQIKNGAEPNDVMQRITADMDNQKARQEAKKASTKEIGNKRVNTSTGEVDDILTYQMTVKGDKQSLTQLKQFMSSHGIEVLNSNLMGGKE